MAEEDNSVAWITDDRFDLDAFVQHCRTSSNDFGTALETALTGVAIGNAAGLSLQPNLADLSDVEEQLLVEKMATFASFHTMRASWRSPPQAEPTEFASYQSLINRLLSAIPTIDQMEMCLERGQGEAFQVDFLRPSDRPPLRVIVLVLAPCWIQTFPLLIPVLRSCQEVGLAWNHYEPSKYVDAACLADLLRPGSSLVCLALPSYYPSVFDDSACLTQLAKSLSQTDCQLEELSLWTMGTDDEASRVFFSALADNQSLQQLFLEMSSCSVGIMIHMSAAIAANQGLKLLSWEVEDFDGTFSLLPLATAIGTNMTLENVSISNDMFDDEAAVHLARLLRQPERQRALRYLDLEDAGVGSPGAVALAQVPTLRHLNLSCTSIDGSTVASMVELCSSLPNLIVRSHDIDLQGAIAVASTVGRQSIVICHNLDTKHLVETYSSVDSNGNYLPGCVMADNDASRQRVVELFQKHAELKHIWYLDCGPTQNEKIRAEMDLYQTLNRKIPTDIRQRMINAEPLGPKEWCTALGALMEEPLNCVYHVVAKWRLEGSSHYRVPLMKRRSIHDGKIEAKKTRVAG